ncbi:uncharacterized protein LOC122400106 [Colletes gigas]|uniref:uncharacterized protein LOC122400106 n=1 Tax=Colletes gigas TaxID=935657 RepID=UPI001C9B881E|nr:uncharacterized protein LOC122400106 [Colletes gigas]
MNECRAGESKWIDCHFRKLIPLYRKSSCLWKRDSRHYLDNERRYRAYRYIRDNLAIPGVSLIEILLRIREMRRLYVLELKKLLEAESSGDHRANTYPWFYDLHRFLYPYLDYEEAVELHVRIDKFKHHEFVICGLHSASSNSDSFETDSDNYDAFSTTVTRLLRKLDRPFAIKAQRKIQKILSIFLAESNVTIRNFRSSYL